jgi:cation diffusion facilitator CzcD-associated flavoprotein CzcO
VDPTEAQRVRVAVIGAGPGGIALASLLERAGITDYVLLEKAAGIGGTWRRSTYPGAECDVPSHLYSFAFALNPDWSKSFAGQQEILDYLERCVDTAGIRDRVRCSTTVECAEWSERQRAWILHIDTGETVTADVVVSAVGMFNAIAWPDIEGLDQFGGTVMHSAEWDDAVDLGGRRVAVIGTGASAIQIVPAIAEQVSHLSVFQRSPAWIMPRRDEPFSDEDRERFRTEVLEARRLRHQIYLFYERNTLTRVDDPRRDVLEAYARAHLEASIPDPALRAELTPDYPIGCKRILVSDDFYPTLLRDDVDLVTAPIERVTPDAVVTADGVAHDVDVIVLATGYRATDYLHGLEVVGRDGRRLREEWARDPRAYLGMTVPGYPNLFVFYGPNTNQSGNSILLIIEAQARYVVGVLEAMSRDGISSVEVRQSVTDAYNDELDEAMEGTVWLAGCANYFRTPTGRVATQLPHPSRWYVRRVRRPELDDYHLTREE